MINWIKDIFDYPRSLTGNGNLKTLKYLKKINKELKIYKVKSKTKVFDWKVPLEWEVKDAFFQHIQSKKKFADFKKNPLHLVNYSTAINDTLNKNQLIKKIYTVKKMKNAIPYVTSYYKKNWGFCLAENEKKKLPSGKYKVFIDTKFSKGHMYMSELVLKGKSKKEIFFSTYICHPGMANNELSGPVVMSALIKFIKENFKKRYYTYRFVFNPETIGAITYIKNNKNKLIKNVIAAYNLSCLGRGNFSFVMSRKEKTLADISLEALLLNKKYTKYSFLDHRGSDERQYCWPGIDLPMVTFCKKKFDTYKEYHTSLDNIDFIREKDLADSLNQLSILLKIYEIGIYPKTNTFCEPNLGKRNLYPLVSNASTKELPHHSKDILNFLCYSDGKTNIFEIAIKIKLNLEKILVIYILMIEKKLVNNSHLIKNRD